jgi:hypothetical protein
MAVILPGKSEKSEFVNWNSYAVLGKIYREFADFFSWNWLVEYDSNHSYSHPREADEAHYVI